MQKKRRKREQGKWQENRIEDKRVKKGLIEKYVNGRTGNIKKWKKKI